MVIKPTMLMYKVGSTVNGDTDGSSKYFRSQYYWWSSRRIGPIMSQPLCWFHHSFVRCSDIGNELRLNFKVAENENQDENLCIMKDKSYIRALCFYS